ncbi:MAG: 1-(5-phosphoribosyl)-5-[(5-phosphoribosylamino)methylideneamino]imidazole-4-carboxamide isomerase [Bacteroidota bacterium]
MRIIPAIDIIEGKCVRLSKGDYTTKKVYNQNPVEVARQFEDSGIQHVHLVDLDGAKSKHIVNYKVLEKISHATALNIDFGGGLKSDQDVRIAFECGARQVTAGSIAATTPDVVIRWMAQYGTAKIILGADCLNRKIATNGWLAHSELDVIDFIKDYETKGIQYVICTDINKDGMLEGPATDLYKEIQAKTNINLIASGGVSNIQDVAQLAALGCEGAIIGKAIYEGNITLKTLKKLC